MIPDYTLGNRALLDLSKVAFLCSRRCPASIVTRSYDWAIEKRNAGVCVLSGNHSQIEKDVFHYLLKGNQPMLKKRLEEELTAENAKNRLLIITPLPVSVKRVTQETANKRNDLMAEIADEIFVAYAQLNGNVYRLIKKWLKKGKKVSTFDVPDNRELIDAGVEKV